MHERDENMFRALFTPEDESKRPDVSGSPYRRRLKWDWHLRNALYALLPAAFVYVVAELQQRRVDAMIVRKKLLEETMVEKAPGEHGVVPSLETLDEIRKSIADLRHEVEQWRPKQVSDHKEADCKEREKAPKGATN